MNHKAPQRQIYETSASAIVEAQTERIKRIFKRSNPHPRNRAMGFKGDDKPKQRFP